MSLKIKIRVKMLKLGWREAALWAHCSFKCWVLSAVQNQQKCDCGSDLRDSDRTTYPSGWNLLKYWRAAWGRWQRGRCALLGFLGNKSRAWSQRELVLGVISVMETAASAEWASVITGCTGREKKWQLPRGMGPRGAGQLFKQHKVSVTVGLIGISLNISVIQPRAGSQMLADDFSEVCVGDDGIYR